MSQVIAVDWSGARVGAGKTIWLARVVGGRLVDLANGRDRDEVIDAVIARVAVERRTFVGLDFSFSFPAWYCAQQGWRTGPQVWAATRDRAEALLAAAEPPFWGRRGSTAPPRAPRFRSTEEQLGGQPKSIFQINGPGSVGTGSLRGMGQLVRLRAAGCAIWPFDPPAWPCVLEVYPRLFAAGTVKSRPASRREHLARRFPDQDPLLMERAGGSDDAFDAAVAALGMARDLRELTDLPPIDPASPETLEGRVWTPTSGQDDENRRSRPQ